MNKHHVTLLFEDGRSEQILADEKDTIYLACLRNKIRILTDCLEGACATCKGVCVEGEYQLDDYSEEALSEEEAVQREVLTCQMHAHSDCIIEFPYESRLAVKTEPAKWVCSVIACENVSSAVVRLDLKPLGGQNEPPAFLPGQYVHLSVPGTGESRSYSFANNPQETQKFSFYIKVLQQGLMSEYVRNAAKVGDEIVMTGPFGRFYLRNPQKPILMVAGGTGLAPMLSMFNHMVETNAMSNPVHLLYGSNAPDEFFCLNDLEAYKEKGIKLTTEFSVLEADNKWNGSMGHITDLLRDELISKDMDTYLCGPPPMIEAAQRWLGEHGVPEKQIYAEKFLPS